MGTSQTYDFVCAECSKSFQTLVSSKKYCSQRCSTKAQHRRDRDREKNFVCTWCSNPFNAKQGGGAARKYCSKQCRVQGVAALLRKTKPAKLPLPEKLCSGCGKSFQPRHAAQKNCAYNCRDKRTCLVPKDCIKCGKSFQPARSNQIYCSNQCRISTGGSLYFVLSIHTQRLKVGISGQVDSRIDHMRRAAFDDLTVLGVIPGDYALEQAIHAELEPYNIHHEFFDYRADAVKELVSRYLNLAESPSAEPDGPTANLENFLPPLPAPEFSDPVLGQL